MLSANDRSRQSAPTVDRAPTVRSLLTEKDLAAEFLAALAARLLPEKFFYWFPLSVRAWLDLCSDGDYRNYVRSRSLIATSAPELAAIAPSGPLEVLSLGSGQGDKDAILLRALSGGRSDLRYTPVDTSQALLEMAIVEAGAADVRAEGVKADLTNADHLEALRASPDAPPRLVMLIGNTLGAFDAVRYAETLAGFLREQDLLLVDGELYSGPETLAGYDNPVNRSFAWAPLHAVGIRDEDGELRFETADDPEVPGLYAVTKHFEAGRDIEAMAGGTSLRLAAGERVAMSRSGKYERETFVGILEDAGLPVRWLGNSEDGNFVMALAGGRHEA
ncbi:MAG TPA: L-histidine N(alpha)-methyltransferase [Actinomycetota bacterium]